MNTAAKSAVRFLAHTVKNGEASARVHYSECNHRMVVTVYARDYGHDLQKVFAEGYKNDTDLMSDYHDKGRVTLGQDHPLYSAALKRCRENRAKNEARWAKTQARRAEKQAAREAELAEFRAMVRARKAVA